MSTPGLDDDTDIELSDSWVLHPLVIGHAPTEDDLRRSPALRGVEDLLYNSGPVTTQGTYKTQGNNIMEELRSGALSPEARHDKLQLAARLYTAAIDVDVTESIREGDLTEEEHRRALAVLYSNRAECNRLLQRLVEAYADACLANRSDRTYFKAYLRKARICEELRDTPRAVANYKRAWDLSFKEEVRRQLAAARDRLRAEEEALRAVVAMYKAMDERLVVGKPLPICNVELSPGYARANCETLFVVYPEYYLVERITDFSYLTTASSIADILFGHPRGDPTFDSNYTPETVRFYYGVGWADRVGPDGCVKAFSSSDVEYRRLRREDTFLSVATSGEYVLPFVPTLFAVGAEYHAGFAEAYRVVDAE